MNSHYPAQSIQILNALGPILCRQSMRWRLQALSPVFMQLNTLTLAATAIRLIPRTTKKARKSVKDGPLDAFYALAYSLETRKRFTSMHTECSVRPTY
jgi:hypothetical protein